MQINNETNWVLGEFLLNTLGYSVVSITIFLLLPISLYKLFKHIKQYGREKRINYNHIFKGEKPLLILLFESTLLIVGSYFLIIEGKLFEYIKNVTIFLNS